MAGGRSHRITVNHVPFAIADKGAAFLNEPFGDDPAGLLDARLQCAVWDTELASCVFLRHLPSKYR